MGSDQGDPEFIVNRVNHLPIMDVSKSGGRVTDRAAPPWATTAAGASSLNELRGYRRRLDAANKPVQDAVGVIRGQLGLPPPDTS